MTNVPDPERRLRAALLDHAAGAGTTRAATADGSDDDELLGIEQLEVANGRPRR